ncbi:MAG: protein-(glutamine-N5) methyltransferase, release factor-specific [Bdellovibrionales bacterium RIFCSPHIGHO2_01_FULL_40_29]|nr:MAG: protein-(glutamine-N5) methyltransferase, release factor-specific [Bdellovibrionales bacterium RIFCSPHIGHO2_01_FULL_40_29]OFZ33150.1 MAG: protein-(glutamine-N5) methyltransferase, release factor-specific [Bdellovibrionales bacterium RIFCSPHIGHO2_02_FULL_40_15]
MKLKEVLDKSIQFFKDKKLETPRLDAEMLLAHALKLERLQLYMKYEAPLSDAEVSLCREVVRRRSQGEPVAYITGERGFYGLVFKVGPGVLIPRPETEHLVELALDFIKTRQVENPKILDLGAGTGCIGFSILKNSPQATLVSIEKSDATFEYLKSNCQLLGLEERSRLIHADIDQIKSEELGQFDIIVSNPPYIANDDPAVESMVKCFEPHEALFAESNGLGLLQSWSKRFVPNLKPFGFMGFEMGYQQGLEMKTHFEKLEIFNKVDIIKDLSGLDRIIKGVR